MAMLAHAFLTVVAATERTRAAAPAGWISLTCNEVQHPFATLVITPITDIAHRLRCSTWRRRHNTEPSKPTTSDDPLESHDHHDLRLEY